jgi:hypothetical protein
VQEDTQVVGKWEQAQTTQEKTEQQGCETKEERACSEEADQVCGDEVCGQTDF